jgi:serine kinase of HPr protein (carbohydrate metabolism regulator)
MTPDTDTTLTYSLLGHVITIQGAATSPTLPDRLDALLGPRVSGNERRTGRPTVLTIRRDEDGWQLADQSGVSPCESLRTEEEVAQYAEWMAYSATIRHATLPLLLHSGAVARNGVAVLLPNVSGAGKTTLTLALAARGWLPLTDDICPLVERDGELVAIGCRRCCHLTPHSLAALRAQGVTLEGPLGGMSLYFYRPRDWAEPAPVRAIVIPRYASESPTRFAPITQAECLGQLMHMTFPQEDIPAYERRRTAARLAARVRGFTLTYSALEEALDVFETLEARLIAHATNVFAVTGQIQGGTSL